jgi:hypothetical protein
VTRSRTKPVQDPTTEEEALRSRRARAKQARQKAQRYLKQAEDLRQEATLLQEFAEKLERLDANDLSEGLERYDTASLPPSSKTVNVEGMNTGEEWSHALKIARGKAKDPFSRACVRAGMTQGEVVEKVRKELKMPKLALAAITQARKGDRRIRRDVAEAIERLIGYAATRANWKGGIRDIKRD